MIIPASAHHAEALAAVHSAAFAGGETWGAGAFRAQLGLPSVLGLLHRAGGLILLRIVADEAEVLTFGMAAEARRQGCGRALLRAAMAMAGQRGAASVVLEVDACNVAACRLYAGQGFVVVGRRAGYYAGGGDALVMRAPTPCGSAR